MIGGRCRIFGIALLVVLVGRQPSAQDAVTAFAANAIPMQSGVTIVQAIAGDTTRGDAQGDYEATIVLDAATKAGVRLQSRAFVRDRQGQRRWLSVVRQIRQQDLQSARRQILGFDTDDAETIPESTSVGPSLDVVRDIVQKGQTAFVVRNFASRPDNVGTLQRVEHVAFPVLVNGERVTLPAIHVRGQLGVPGSVRPWELHILDHPVHPITLKVSYGPESGAVTARPEWSRQVVRIDFAQPANRMAAQLTDACRARVPGVYFEFDSDLLNPASAPAIAAIADLLRRQSAWTVEIEGHTDNVGGGSYNMDLSARRSASVKRALVEQGIAASRMTSRGFGLTRPVESNDTIEGRARNRRVELVRPCEPRGSSGDS